MSLSLPKNLHIVELPIYDDTARAFVGTLGDRFIFPHESITTLPESLEQLSRVEVDQEAFFTGIKEQLEVESVKTSKIAISKHENASKRGSIATIDQEDTIAWTPIPSKISAGFTENISTVAGEIFADSSGRDKLFDTKLSELCSPNTTETDQETEKDILLSKVLSSYLTEKFVPLLEELFSIVPDSNDPDVYVMYPWLERYIGNRLLAFASIENPLPYQTPREIGLIIKKSNNVKNFIKKFVENPSGALIQFTVDKIQPQISEDISGYINYSIASSNSELLATTTIPKKSKPSRNASHKPRKQKATIPSPTIVDADKKIPAQDTTEPMIQPIGTEKISLPWLEQSFQELSIGELQAYGSSVYVINAIDSRLQDISDDIRKNMTLNEDGLNAFDLAISQEAKRIAGGIMPWTNTNSVKALKRVTSKIPGDFSLPIWYTFDMSPNAPRVYFTVKKLAEIIDSSSKSARDLTKECLILIAETDKSNQTDVLKVLTGSGHKTLRSNGAGSV
ncbi:MAG: hypothetical protein WCO19_05150 [Candidatus Saccharibacteria bacterium]